MKAEYLMFGLEAVEKLIPQRKPMIMVDGLLQSDGLATISTLQIREDNIFVEDRQFREPGLIENMAQTAALRAGYEAIVSNKKPLVGFIGAIKRLQIYNLPKVGDQLETKIEIVNELLGAMIVHATTVVQGDLVAEADLSIFLTEPNEN